MNSETVFYIIGIGILALLVALFQYLYKSKRTKLNKVLSVIRFLTFFTTLLLLLNPKVDKTTVVVEKPNLVVAIDNSESITHLNQSENVSTVLNSIRSNSELSNRFNISYYSIGSSLSELDSLAFNSSYLLQIQFLS